MVEREINSSKAAADQGDLTSAAGDAKTARSIEPWAASPYVQLGLVAEQAGEYGQAAEEIDKAIEREDRNWVLYALRSRIDRENDEPAAARQDFEEARRLNPLAPREQLEGE